MDGLLEWLGHNDALTLGERVSRLRFLVALNDEYGPGWLGFYNQAHEYLEYAARCYLEGLFVPCIIMCQTAAEEQMKGLLRSSGLEDVAARPMSEILRERRVRALLPRPLLRQIETLRSRRNIYVHPPGPYDEAGRLDSRWLPNRMVARKLEAEELHEGDAQTALRAVADLFRLPPGGLAK
jgi:HEPN domain-containing protein